MDGTPAVIDVPRQAASVRYSSMAKGQNRDAEPRKTRDGEGRRVCPACNEPIGAGAVTVPFKPHPVHKDCWDRIRNGTARLESD